MLDLQTQPLSQKGAMNHWHWSMSSLQGNQMGENPKTQTSHYLDEQEIAHVTAHGCFSPGSLSHGVSQPCHCDEETSLVPDSVPLMLRGCIDDGSAKFRHKTTLRQ